METQAYITLLSFIVFLPAAGAIILAFLPKNADNACRYTTLAITATVLVATLIGFWGSSSTRFDTSLANMQNAFNANWIPSFNIYYFMGVDGISFPLIMLTALVSM